MGRPQDKNLLIKQVYVKLTSKEWGIISASKESTNSETLGEVISKVLHTCMKQ